MQIQENSKIYGGFFVRLAAFLLDMLIVGLLSLMFIGPMEFAAIFAGSDSFFTKSLLFEFTFFDILEYLVITAYFVLTTYYSGATLGKRLFNLKVVSADGEPLTFWNVLYRETIGRYLSSLLFVGYIMVGVDKEKCGLHDRLSDTRVEYQCKLPAVRQVVQVAAAVPYPAPYPQQGYSQPRPAQPIPPQPVRPQQPQQGYTPMMPRPSVPPVQPVPQQVKPAENPEMPSADNTEE